MKIELTDKEVILIIGSLSLLDRVEKSQELDSLRIKITRQHIEELKKVERAEITAKTGKDSRREK